jgi:Family of unknown function (DUF6088)
LRQHLKRGKVYRRCDLEKWSKAVDRHLSALLSDGTLEKLSQGVYYYPKQSAFGKTPPEERELVSRFLKDDKFLVTSPNDYNTLGVGTTQLYNKRIVYNHKRHGEFKLGNRTFSFRMKPQFPKEATQEFLLVDLVNNLKDLAEDQSAVLEKVKEKTLTTDPKKLHHSVSNYGTVRAKKLFASL